MFEHAYTVCRHSPECLAPLRIAPYAPYLSELFRLWSSSTCITTAGCDFPRRVEAHGSMQSNASCLLWVSLTPCLDCSKGGGEISLKKWSVWAPPGPSPPLAFDKSNASEFLRRNLGISFCPDCSGGGRKENSWGKFYQLPGPFWAGPPPLAA